jgi:hypothetical protein
MIPLLTAAIVAAVAGLATGCGNSQKLLPPSRASALDTALGQISDATRAGECQQALDALGSAQKAYAALPASVDDALMARLRDGLQQLTETVPVQCKAAADQTQPATTPSTTATTTTPSTTTTTTEPTTTTTTTTTATTTEPPTTATTTPPTDTLPNGGVPPGQEKKNQTDTGATTP